MQTRKLGYSDLHLTTVGLGAWAIGGGGWALLPYCEANNIGVVAYSPLQAGLLTGKFSKERLLALPEDDWRTRDRHFQEPEFSVNLEFVQSLRPIAERNGRTCAQLAIAWVLRQPVVTAAIAGARHPAQIRETVLASDWALSAGDIAELDDLLAQRNERLAQLPQR